jgi:hypothetical protein
MRNTMMKNNWYQVDMVDIHNYTMSHVVGYALTLGIGVCLGRFW